MKRSTITKANTMGFHVINMPVARYSLLFFLPFYHIEKQSSIDDEGSYIRNFSVFRNGIVQLKILTRFLVKIY